MKRGIRWFCLILGVAGTTLGPSALADSVPFWGAKSSVPIDTPVNQLKKGQFLWMGEAVTRVLWSWSSASRSSEPMFIVTGS